MLLSTLTLAALAAHASAGAATIAAPVLTGPTELTGPTGLPGPPERLAIHAAKIVLGEQGVLEDAWLTVENGVIRQVGRGVRVPDDWPRIEHDGVLTAGLIAFSTGAGIGGDYRDATRTWSPQLEVAYEFDAEHADFRHALEQGVTALVLLPSGLDVAGGRAVVVKTSGGAIVERSGPLSLSPNASAANRMRAPTGYAGAVRMLEDQLADPKGALADAAAGKLLTLIHASSRQEGARALALAAHTGLHGALYGMGRVGGLEARLAESGLGVVFAPLEPGDDSRALASPAALAEAGVPFAFALDHTTPLRLGLALARREGLGADDALASVTTGAARLAGVSDRLGELEAGRDADFVLWDGDPTDITTPVRAVFMGGELVAGELR